jgi:hypothetical protein
MSMLQQKDTPMPTKVAGVEVLKEMLQDEDESTADAVKSKLDAHPEVRDTCFLVCCLTCRH